MVPSFEAVAKAIADAHGFVLVGPVGAGVFKETYEARDGESRHAVKVFRPGANIERVNREVRAAVLCSHPNIARLAKVDVIDVGPIKFLYAIEEFLSGGTLGARIERGGLLSTVEAFSIGAQLVDAIDHVAGHRLVHRDIKLENIMLRGDGISPVLVDFGLVRALGEPSLTKSWIGRGPGTPFFASPEQLCNDKHLIDWRADQFSLGVTLAVATFGHHPYRESADDSDSAIVDRVSERSTPVPQSFIELANRAGLPALAQMVAPWPVQRFRTPDALSAAWQAQSRES